MWESGSGHTCTRGRRGVGWNLDLMEVLGSRVGEHVGIARLWRVLMFSSTGHSWLCRRWSSLRNGPFRFKRCPPRRHLLLRNGQFTTFFWIVSECVQNWMVLLFLNKDYCCCSVTAYVSYCCGGVSIISKTRYSSMYSEDTRNGAICRCILGLASELWHLLRTCVQTIKELCLKTIF